MIKKIISVLMIMALLVGFSATAFSAQDAEGTKSEEVMEQTQVEKGVQCTVIEIEGTKVTLQCDDNTQLAINCNDQKILQDLKVGDKVLVKNGKIKKQKEE